jgi:hypothetical protein
VVHQHVWPGKWQRVPGRWFRLAHRLVSYGLSWVGRWVIPAHYLKS